MFVVEILLWLWSFYWLWNPLFGCENAEIVGIWEGLYKIWHHAMSRTASVKQTHFHVVELFCNRRNFLFPRFILYLVSVSTSGGFITMTTHMFSIMYILRSRVFCRYPVHTCDGFPITVTEWYSSLFSSRLRLNRQIEQFGSMSGACYTRSSLVQFESRLRHLPAILRLSVATLSSDAECRS